MRKSQAWPPLTRLTALVTDGAASIQSTTARASTLCKFAFGSTTSSMSTKRRTSESPMPERGGQAKTDIPVKLHRPIGRFFQTHLDADRPETHAGAGSCRRS
jgi:hypothetical protein